MAKKKLAVSYDKEALNAMAIEFKMLRKPVEETQVPELEIDLFALEETVKGLPNKEREKLEKYWGLIPGTIKRDKMLSGTKNLTNISLLNMRQEARLILDKMMSIEYLYFFDRKARELIKKFASKIDKTGIEEISDIDAVKYIIMLFVFFVGGPTMPYDEEDGEIKPAEEMTIRHDKYALLNTIWHTTGHELAEKSINLRLFIEVLEMMDLKDVITMKKFANLPISREYSDIETESVDCLWKVRKFKERIFTNGGWEVMMALVYRPDMLEKERDKFFEMLEEMNIWEIVLKSETSDQTIKTSEGEKTIKIYKIAGLEFSDTYELEVLYLCRNYC